MARKPRRSRRRSRSRDSDDDSPQDQKDSDEGLSTLAWAGILVLALVGVGFFFWLQDSRMAAYGQEKIRTLKTSKTKKQVMAEMAKYFHNRAMHRAAPKNIRGQKDHAAVSKSAYWQELKGLMLPEVKSMFAGKADESHLAGKRFEMMTEEIMWVVEFKSSGIYVQNAHLHTDHNHEDVLESFRGKWAVKGKGFHWTHSDGDSETNPILCMSDRGFALRERDKSITYWKRIR